jgi:hypothetical protein
LLLRRIAEREAAVEPKRGRAGRRIQETLEPTLVLRGSTAAPAGSAGA